MDAKPLHIGAFPSGGSTLTYHFVNGHPSVAVTGELPLLPKVLKRFDAEVPSERLAEAIEALYECDFYESFGKRVVSADDFDPRDTYSFAEIYYRLLMSGGRPPMCERPDARWFGNETPQNTEYLDDLIRIMPESRFILVTRDVRDTALSWRNKWGKDMLGCAHRWQARMGAGIEKVRALGEKGMILRFEDLLESPATEAQRIATFLDLPDWSLFESFAQRNRRVVDGNRYSDSAIVADNKAKWRTKLTEREARRIEEIAFTTMTRAGYEPEYAKAPRPASAFEVKRSKVRDLIAMVAVGNRYKAGNTLRNRLRQLSVALRRRSVA